MANNTYAKLASRLIDLERLAKVPREGERCVEYSSTDKRSRYDADEDRYIDWDANADADGIVRMQEDGGKVLAETDGPGCLCRIWFGCPEREGRIKIYLDGEEEPAIDFATHEFFTEGEGPFALSNLCYESVGMGCKRLPEDGMPL